MGYSSKPSKQKSETATLKQERSQYIQMLLSAQAGREINENVFGSENNKYPPSLSRNGEMYFGTKSDLLACLEEGVIKPSTIPECDGEIIDGCVMLRFVTPGQNKGSTFSQYASSQMNSYKTELC